jgi:NAD(P)H-flavin reductase
MSTLHAASVREVWDETPYLRGLRLEIDVPAGAPSTHRAPGQYVKLRAGDQEGYFALANPPGSPAELLVKRGGAVGDALAGLGGGARIEVSDAQGRGYPVDESAGRDLLLFAAGSGITPIRAVIAHVAGLRTRYGHVTLFYGHRRPDEFAYRGELGAWTQANVDVVHVVSQPDGSGWSGATGHVQDVLLSAHPSTERAVAFVCGMKPMVAAVTDALASLGLPKERVHLNY